MTRPMPSTQPKSADAFVDMAEVDDIQMTLGVRATEMLKWLKLPLTSFGVNEGRLNVTAAAEELMFAYDITSAL